MKNLFYWILLMIFIFDLCNYCFAQSIFYDALYLKKDDVFESGKHYLDIQKDSLGANILWKYLPDSVKKPTNGKISYDVLQNYYDNIHGNGIANPFIDLPGIKEEAVNIPASNLISMVSNPGALDVTTLADGMAKFLVKRAKQELSITFFEKFKEVIADAKYKDLRTLFPATYATLTVIGDQIYYYDAYLQMLRDSFKRDLRDLPLHLPIIIDNHPDYFAYHPEVEAIFRSCLYVYDSVSNGKTFGPILENYPINYLNKLNPNIKASVQTAILISESFRDTAIVSRPNAYWVKAQQIDTLVDDSIAFRIYLGLLYQQAKNKSITFANNVSLTSVLDSVAIKYYMYSAAYRKYFLEVGNRIKTLTTLIDDYKTLSSDTMKIERYSQYISAGIDLLETATDVSNLGLQDSSVLKVYTFFKHVQNSLSTYITTVRSAANLVCDIKQRNYTSAIINTVNIYEETFSDTSTEMGKTLLKYGTFMASVAQAKTSDEVESAIEVTALPAGSARLKKESCFDVSLNAYVGGFYGREIEQSANISSTSNIYGINAPIGIALSTSFCNWSITLFGSFIDLGAVTAYRVRNDTISSLPKLALANIIAPGIHIVLGIKGAPISLGFGWQIGPQLRDVTSTATEISNMQGYRWAAFVAVDIPLLDFYNKPKY